MLKQVTKNALALFVLAIVATGTISLVRAATNSIAIEAEAGASLVNSVVVNDTNASGGKYVEFRGSSQPPSSGTPTTGPIADIASNFDSAAYINRPAPWGIPKVGYPAFRFFCEFSHLGYYDPIVAPGQANGSHLHQFFGNAMINKDSSYQSLRTTGESTCSGGPLNRTAYWMPALLNASGKVMVPDDYELYYKAENAPLVNGKRQVTSFPNGLRMIAGARMDGKPIDPSATTPNVTWGWNCDGGSVSATIPNCPVGVRLVGTVRFPYCWDGVNLDSADHRSHLRYGTGNTWGPCPAGYTHITEVTEFIHYKSHNGDTGSWKLSSDMGQPNGSTFHADWFGAWDPTIQNTWLNNCLRANTDSVGGMLCNGSQLSFPANYSGPTVLNTP